MKDVLKKPGELRTEFDISILEPMLRETEFIKNRKELTKADLIELAKSFKLLEIDAFENVFQYGDDAEYFYVIIQGVVSVQVRN